VGRGSVVRAEWVRKGPRSVDTAWPRRSSAPAASVQQGTRAARAAIPFDPEHPSKASRSEFRATRNSCAPLSMHQRARTRLKKAKKPKSTHARARVWPRPPQERKAKLSPEQRETYFQPCVIRIISGALVGRMSALRKSSCGRRVASNEPSLP